MSEPNMRCNLSQVGNPGGASMGDGMKPERLSPHTCSSFVSLKNLKAWLAVAVSESERGVDAWEKKRRESGSDSA